MKQRALLLVCPVPAALSSLATCALPFEDDHMDLRSMTGSEERFQHTREAMQSIKEIASRDGPQETRKKIMRVKCRLANGNGREILSRLLSLSMYQLPCDGTLTRPVLVIVALLRETSGGPSDAIDKFTQFLGVHVWPKFSTCRQYVVHQFATWNTDNDQAEQELDRDFRRALRLEPSGVDEAELVRAVNRFDLGGSNF